MARKHLLSDLAQQELPAGNSPLINNRSTHPAPQTGGAGMARGAVGAVTRSLEQLRSQSVIELKADTIDASPIADRLPDVSDAHAELVASIRQHGQQVPVLVRPHPVHQGRYQIAYGRRRLRAIKELAIPVRCFVKNLTDEELVVAQGTENTARADLTFIERALFAANLEAGGFSRDTIMAALSVDKTGLSRLISSASRVPRELIGAIGPAPKAGRDRWVELAARLEVRGVEQRIQVLVTSEAFAAKSSDERFSLILDAVAPKRRLNSTMHVISSRQGRKIATYGEHETKVTLMIDRKEEAFATFLKAELPRIYAEFQIGRTEQAD